jgi:hypothetical protein
VKHLVIDRVHDRGEHGVFGTADLLQDERPLYSFFSGEEEWRDNQPNISCIPVGAYALRKVASPKFGDTYQICDVPGRKNVLVHWGNTEEDTEGCVLLGLSMGFTVVEKDEETGKRAKKLSVLQSKAAWEKFMKLMGGEDGLVTIRWYGE